MCLKNSRSNEEQILAMTFKKKMNESIIQHMGHCRDIFSSDTPRINTVRKISADAYRDILVSYHSALTKTRRYDVPDVDATGNVVKTRKSAKSPQSKSKTKGKKKFHLFGKQRQSGQEKKDKNYSIFALTELEQVPFLKIRKKRGYHMYDNQDIHVEVTNAESLKSFFVMLSLNNHCLFKSNYGISTRTDAKLKLDFLNSEEKGKKEYRKAFEGTQEGSPEVKTEKGQNEFFRSIPPLLLCFLYFLFAIAILKFMDGGCIVLYYIYIIIYVCIK